MRIGTRGFIVAMAVSLVVGSAAIARVIEPLFEKDGYGFVPWHLTAGIYFNHPVPKGYELKASQNKNGTLEYGLIGESLNDWSELTTYTVFAKPNPADLRKKVIDSYIKGFESQCRTIRPSKFPADPEEDGVRVQNVLIQCLHNGSFASRDLREDVAIKFMDTDWGFFTQQFAVRQKAGDDLPLPTEEEFNKLFSLLNAMVMPCQKDGNLGFRKCSSEEAFY